MEPLVISPEEVAKMTPAQKAKAIELIKEQLNEINKIKEEEISKNPFYFFHPDKGVLTPDRKSFLRKWLKEEDIPHTVDSQLQALCDDSDIKLISGGNQSGKSTLEAIEDYIDITKQIPAPLQGTYPREKIPKKIPFHVRTVAVDNKQLLNTVLPAYRFWVPRDFLRKGKWEESYSAEQRLLTLVKGNKTYGTVEFMTNQMEVESFQGPPKDKVNYDEEPLFSIYKENLLRFVTAEKLRIRFHMTPTKGMTWVKTQILDENDGKRKAVFKLPTVCNPKANLEVVEEILKELTSYDEIKMRLLGAFISLSGLVYGELFSRKKVEEGGHVIEPIVPDFDNYVVYRGGDPHLVKPSVFVELAVDREENKYVIGVYSKNCDTAEIKADLLQRSKTRGKDERGWRLAQTRVDKSCNSTIRALGDRNIFLELSRGQDAIPAMVTSEKFVGSINAGVDTIKQELKNRKLFFCDTPEVWQLIKAMESLEREMATNEEKTGMRDKIAEGRFDAHAALRYIFQGPVRWMPIYQSVPDLEDERYI